MSAPRTTVAELGTAVGLLGLDIAEVDRRPASLVNVTSERWNEFAQTLIDGQFLDVFERARRNGRAFLYARDGLRERLPLRVEWKGDHRKVGYENLPADLRVDHVYLISCKDNSRILMNPSPTSLFDGCLDGSVVDPGDWYALAVPDEYQLFYEQVRSQVAPHLPASVLDLDAQFRTALKEALPNRAWPLELQQAYASFCRAVETATVARWRANIGGKSRQELMYWRLIRLASAPYFLLGSVAGEDVRLRVGTPWDWRQSFEFQALRVLPTGDAGQPTVRWQAEVVRRSTGDVETVLGHIEVRWSKGRFKQAPEAKVVLDSPHVSVAGYFGIE